MVRKLLTIYKNIVSQHSINTNVDKPKQLCHHCKRPRHYWNYCRLLKRQKNSLKVLKLFLETKTVAPIILSQTTRQTRIATITTTTKTMSELKKSQKTVYPPCETCRKTNHSAEKFYYGANEANRPPPRHRKPERQNEVQEKDNQSDSN